MQAHVGDELVISGHYLGEAPRVGRITEVRGDDGGPPYKVMLDESGRATLLFPGPDCSVKSPAGADAARSSQ